MNDLPDPSELLTCADCAAAINELETFCAIADEEVLCWECALRRGGSFDAATDRWTVMPDAGDLVHERPIHRSHAG